MIFCQITAKNLPFVICLFEISSPDKYFMQTCRQTQVSTTNTTTITNFSGNILSSQCLIFVKSNNLKSIVFIQTCSDKTYIIIIKTPKKLGSFANWWTSLFLKIWCLKPQICLEHHFAKFEEVLFVIFIFFIHHLDC